jgi:hypothetical protein
MRKTIFTLVPVIGLLLPVMVPAQATLYVSNLGQAETGSMAVGSDSRIAQRIITGTDSSGYILNSVQLLMDAASGSPSGFNVSIYSSLSGNPNSNLGNLVGSDPSAGGIFTYTASGITLSPGAGYFVVATAETPVAQGAYDWSKGNQYADGSNLWEIYPEYFTSPDGSSWTGHGRQNAFQMAIYATAIPEPATLALAALGLAALSFRRRRLR